MTQASPTWGWKCTTSLLPSCLLLAFVTCIHWIHVQHLETSVIDQAFPVGLPERSQVHILLHLECHASNAGKTVMRSSGTVMKHWPYYTKYSAPQPHTQICNDTQWYIYIYIINYTVCIYHVKRVKAFAFDDASSPNEDSDSEVSSESLVKLVLAILLITKDKLRVLCGMNSGRTGRVHRNSEASVYEYRIIQTYLLLSAYCKTVYCK